MHKLILVFSLLLLVSCSTQEEYELKEAQVNTSKGHYLVALSFYDKVIKRNSSNQFPIEASREAARISFYDLKDYKLALNYYKYLVLHSKDEKERTEAQKQIASIYFNNIQDYKNAIVEYSKILELSLSASEVAQHKIAIARAQFYLNNFFQAESEVESVLLLKLDPKQKAQAMLLKGNILVAEKEFNKAAEIFRRLLNENPKFSEEENVWLNLVACLEEGDNFKEAIKVLENYRGKYNPAEYIELRIKRLQERQRNAPGAKGLRK